MHWIKSIFIIVMMIVSGIGEAAHPLAPASSVTGFASPVFAEDACDGCRDALVRCSVRACEPPGVLKADIGARPSSALRIMDWPMGAIRGVGLNLQPVPPPPRG